MCVLFSLSFVRPIFRAPAREPGRTEGERISPPLQYEPVTEMLSFSSYLYTYWLKYVNG